MDIFALNNLLIVSLSVFRLSDARARSRRAGVVPIFDPYQIITPLVEIAIWLPNPNPTPNPNPSPTPNPKPTNTRGGNNLAGVRIGHNTGAHSVF